MTDFLNILSDQRDALMSTDMGTFIARDAERSMNLNSKLAQIVIGVRRSGKSTMCTKHLMESGVNFAYVNFDDERLNGMAADDLNDMLATLYRIYGSFTHLYLDEVQNIAGWHLFVSRMLRQGIKVVLTGSNANLLSSELSTYLTGRYNQVELLPLSFTELCTLKGIDRHSYSTKSMAFRQRLLDEYIDHGGLPEIYTDDVADSYMPSLIHAIVFKDVCVRYKVRYPDVLWQMANMLLDNFCQEVSLGSLAKQLNVSSVHTVKRYVEYLAEAYLICHVPKFSFKSAVRHTLGKVYAIDPAFVTMRGQTIVRRQEGWMIENIVYLELRRRYHLATQSIYYLKQPDFEVDFVVCEAGHVIRLVQVTYNWKSPSAKQYNREAGGLIKGSRFTSCTSLTLVVGDGAHATIEKDGLTIEVIPASSFLSM